MLDTAEADLELIRQERRRLHETYVLVADYSLFPGIRIIVRQCETFADAHREAGTMPERHPAVYRRDRRRWIRAD